MRPAPAPQPEHRIDDGALAPDAIRSLRGSKIREIANAGMHDRDVLAFWFGEPDVVTPQFIRDAATASLARGETFYAQNFGIPELREAIARYATRLHGPTSDANVAVTASGMSANNRSIASRTFFRARNALTFTFDSDHPVASATSLIDAFSPSIINNVC
jgi:DNA-binding transcriptional MocR family regulator